MPKIIKNSNMDMDFLNLGALFDKLKKSEWKHLINEQKYLALVLFFLFAASSVVAYYFYSEAASLKINSQKTSLSESRALVAQIGRLIALPENEEPTIAIVSDPELLKSQPFFANSKKGDRLLIYPNAKKAILYDPEVDKIIEVAPVVIGAAAPAAQTSPSAPSSVPSKK